MRRLPGDAPGLRGRAPDAGGPARRRVLPGGVERGVRRALRPLAGGGVDHHAGRGRAHPRGAAPVGGARRHRGVCHGGGDPGAAQPRGRRRVCAAGLRQPGLPRRAAHGDAGLRPRARRPRAARLSGGEGAASGDAPGVPGRAPTRPAHRQRVRGVQAARDDVRDGGSWRPLPGPGDAGGLRGPVPGRGPRLLRLLRPPNGQRAVLRWWRDASGWRTRPGGRCARSTPRRRPSATWPVGRAAAGRTGDAHDRTA